MHARSPCIQSRSKALFWTAAPVTSGARAPSQGRPAAAGPQCSSMSQALWMGLRCSSSTTKRVAGISSRVHAAVTGLVTPGPHPSSLGPAAACARLAQVPRSAAAPVHRRTLRCASTGPLLQAATTMVEASQNGVQPPAPTAAPQAGPADSSPSPVPAPGPSPSLQSSATSSTGEAPAKKPAAATGLPDTPHTIEELKQLADKIDSYTWKVGSWPHICLGCFGRSWWEVGVHGDEPWAWGVGFVG